MGARSGHREATRCPPAGSLPAVTLPAVRLLPKLSHGDAKRAGIAGVFGSELFPDCPMTLETPGKNRGSHRPESPGVAPAKAGSQAVQLEKSAGSGRSFPGNFGLWTEKTLGKKALFPSAFRLRARTRRNFPRESRELPASPADDPRNGGKIGRCPPVPPGIPPLNLGNRQLVSPFRRLRPFVSRPCLAFPCRRAAAIARKRPLAALRHPIRCASRVPVGARGARSRVRRLRARSRSRRCRPPERP